MDVGSDFSEILVTTVPLIFRRFSIVAKLSVWFNCAIWTRTMLLDNAADAFIHYSQFLTINLSTYVVV